MNQMKWTEDLNRDIRFGNSNDDLDYPFGFLSNYSKKPSQEFTECNHDSLSKAMYSCGNQLKYAMEIGVCRNSEKSSTHTILNNLARTKDSIYLGVDLEDKSFLDNPDRGVYTIKESSSNFDTISKRMKELNIKELDFIHIDGWHSINQVLMDWEYTKYLRKGGVVAFHDVTAHPGPFFFIRNTNSEKWEVHQNLCPMDHGFGYAIKL